jgi:hypothetical protein
MACDYSWEDARVHNPEVGDAMHSELVVDYAFIVERRHPTCGSGMVECLDALAHDVTQLCVRELVEILVQEWVALAREERVGKCRCLYDAE